MKESVQVARTATTTATMTTAGAAPTRATRRFSDRQRVHQRIKALAEQLVDLGYHAAQFGTIKVALHHVDNVLHQQITLHLHDGGRRGADKKHNEIVARLRTLLFLVFVEIFVAERDFDGSTLLGKLIEAHAHFFQNLAKVFIPPHRPAHLQQG